MSEAASSSTDVAESPLRRRHGVNIPRLLAKNIAYVAFFLLVIFFSFAAGDKFLTARNWSLISSRCLC